jgi:hypothetical protein
MLTPPIIAHHRRVLPIIADCSASGASERAAAQLLCRIVAAMRRHVKRTVHSAQPDSPLLAGDGEGVRFRAITHSGRRFGR